MRRAIAILLLVMFGNATAAQACSCVRTVEATCRGLAQWNYLFIGTVVSVEDDTSDRPPLPPGEFYLGGDRIIRIRVDEVFTGPGASEVTVKTGSGGGDCGYGFLVGKQYLVDADEYSGALRTSICSDTRPIEEAGAIIPQLRAMRAGGKPASLYGHLRRSEYDPFSFETIADAPLGLIPITAKSDKDTFEVLTDVDGNYAFADLPVADYTLEAGLPRGLEVPKYRKRKSVRAGGDSCVELDLTAASVARIRGRVVDPVGTSLKEIEISVLPPEGQKVAFGFSSSVHTDSSGNFEISLSPQHYRVEINPKAKHGRLAYQPRQYSNGGTITVIAGEMLDIGTIALEPWPDQYEAQVSVRWDSGEPAPEARVFLTSLPYKVMESLHAGFPVDESGVARVFAVQEYEYKMTAEVECADETTRNATEVILRSPGRYDLVLRGKRCSQK